MVEYIVYSSMYSLHVNKEYISNTRKIYKQYRKSSTIAGYNSLLIIVRLLGTISDDFDLLNAFKTYHIQKDKNPITLNPRQHTILHNNTSIIRPDKL
jgi:hypothetical protein